MTKIQVWGCRLIRVTDHRVPRSCLCVETSSKQLPQGFVLCVTLICIIHHYILFCIVFICTQLHCIKHCCSSNFKALCCIIVPAMHCNAQCFQCNPPEVLQDTLFCFVTLLCVACSLSSQNAWGPFVESTLAPISMLQLKVYPTTCSDVWRCTYKHMYILVHLSTSLNPNE